MKYKLEGLTPAHGHSGSHGNLNAAQEARIGDDFAGVLRQLLQLLGPSSPTNVPQLQ